MVALAKNALHLGGKEPSAYLLVKTANDKFETKNHAANTYATKASPAYKNVGSGKNPDFQNGWQNCNFGWTGAGFYKDSQNIIVDLKGCAFGPSGSKMFKLPAAYRPSQNLWFPIVCHGPTAGYMYIYSDGDVVPYCAGGGPNEQAIDGLTFRVGSGDAGASAPHASHAPHQ
jgi:hypothetical protein